MHWTENPPVSGPGGPARLSATAGPFHFLIVPVGTPANPGYHLTMYHRGALDGKICKTIQEAQSAAIPMAMAQLDKWRQEVEAAWVSPG